MAIYESQYAALRRDTGKTIATLPDPEAEDIFVQAASMYSPSAVYAGARVLVLLPDWQKATEQADYTQNEESEKLGQLAESKRKYLDYWEGKVEEAQAKDEQANRPSAVRSGRTTRKPARLKEYPGS